MLSKYFQQLKSCEIGPNYQFDDAKIALKSLFNLSNFSQIQTQQRIKNIQSFFHNYLNLNDKIELSDLYLLDTGRTGLALILKSLKKGFDWQNNDEVLIQAFSCLVVPNSVLASDLKPVLVDISKDFKNQNYSFDLNDLKTKITPKTRALVLQYPFGLTFDQAKIIDFCQKNNLLLIEDVAHSLGGKVSFENQKHLVGSLGAGAFFSFGRDKIISTTQGGMALINPHSSLIKDSLTQQKLEKSQTFLKELVSKLPKMRNSLQNQNLFYAALTTLLVRPFYHANFGKLVLQLSRKTQLIPEVYTPEEKQVTNQLAEPSLLGQKLLPLLQNQIQKLEKFNFHRRKIAEIYAKKFDLKFDPDSVYLRFPVTFNSKQEADKFNKEFASKGFVLGKWYTDLFLPKIDVSQKFDVDLLTLPNANRAKGGVSLNLPTGIWVKSSDV